MKRNKLGRSDIEVSALCLGSMTWGTQNTQAEGFAQIDYALEHGINFIDTAEMYPVNPSGAETQGRTEEIIGHWFKQSGKRRDVVLATKATGSGMPHIHGGADLSPAKLKLSLESSLKRLQTDYIDLYQLHWPNRSSYHFRKCWGFDATVQPRTQTIDHFREILFALHKHVEAGKIRTIGLSNETCWGVGRFLEIAKDNRLPRVVSVQNEYSLLCRLYDLDMAEMSYHEDVGLLSFSPLAAGLLGGQYVDGKVPQGSRMSINPGLNGRFNEHSAKALEQYVAIAKKHDLHPAQMALAFCISRPFMTSTIFGATSMEQLKVDVGAAELTLTDEVLADIESVHRQYPMPM
jgi:aryl-alcohol dehydrogenase-like predicted oxidoreductase